MLENMQKGLKLLQALLTLSLGIPVHQLLHCLRELAA